MTNLRDLLTTAELDAEIAKGYIRVQSHPKFPYNILNYTEKAQYEGHWNNATLMCRGLIYNYETNEIVARPFPKFFNYSQLTTPPSPDTPLFSVTDKMDGSLGIIYNGTDGSINVATRGSFTSDQAIWATQWLNDHPDVYPHQYNAHTPLVEIVYPQNRIVLDYGTRAGLVLLGMVSIFDGTIYEPSIVPDVRWSGERTETFPEYVTLADVLKAPDRDNAEGLVALTTDNKLIKFKQEDYVKLHRVLTGLTERTVYDILKQDGNVDRLIEIVPDEFHIWVKEVETKLADQFLDLLWDWTRKYFEVLEGMPDGFTQKDFALEAVKYPCKSALFLLRTSDFERLHELVWKQIEPPATKATVPS